MAPIKLEDHIREQFEEREITPSIGAWDKLEAKLDKEQGKKRPVFIWYAIAASIVGLLFITSQFFFNNKSQTPPELVRIETENTIIEAPSTSEILNNETQLAKETVLIEEIKSPEAKKRVEIIEKIPARKNLKPVAKTNENIVDRSVDTRVAVQQREQSSSRVISEVDNKDLGINNKVEEVVVAIQNIQEERNTVTVAEIDALLLSAQRDLAAQRILSKSKVDAMALLNDVELELAKSFRDRVFYALGDSFSKIRTAVVERNN